MGCPRTSPGRWASLRALWQPDLRVLLTILSVTQLTGWGTLYYGFSLFIEPMQQDLGWSRSQIQSAATVALLTWGALSPVVGYLLTQYGSRPVMTGGSVLGGVGLFVWALWPSTPWVFWSAWAMVGASMSMVLYEPAFAVLVRTARDHYQAAITALTLVGGFASTLFLPPIQWVIDGWGWHGAIFALAGANLFVCAPLHVLGLPSRSAHSSATGTDSQEAPAPTKLFDMGLFREPAFKPSVFVGLALWFTLFQAASTALTFLLIPLLSARGVPMATILLCVATIGPMQVAGRALLLGRAGTLRTSSVGTMILVTTLLAVAVLISLPPTPTWLLLFAGLYGAAKGTMTIVRGTAVAEHMGASVYARTNGWLAMTAKIAQAVLPVGLTVLWTSWKDPDAVIWAILAVFLLSMSGLAVIHQQYEQSAPA